MTNTATNVRVSPWIRHALALSVFSLGGCASVVVAPDSVKAAWVVLGENGLAIARVVTSDADCPSVLIDGVAHTMKLRARAETIPLRPTASDPADSKPSSFPASTCEYALPEQAARATVGGWLLPLPKANPQRIVVIGDTGCRMKKEDNAWQACAEPNAWPFAQIAQVAAQFKPDLVLHVGDYHYRENPCPPDIGGCRGSPWGYGWDAWDADLFKPAAPLLAAAPWIMVRGNHEECARGGQGWFRFLDPRPYEVARSCNDAANDGNANYSDPYAVPVGGDTQVIVFDSAKVGRAPLDPASPADATVFAAYQAHFRKVGILAGKPGVLSIFANHHPILGLTPNKKNSIIGGNAALLSVMKSLNATAYYPPGVQIALHGHTHLFEAINFASNHPATFLSGNGGDITDANLPDPLPAGVSPAAGVTLDSIAHSNAFGFMVMDRQGADWAAKAYQRDGTLMTTCAFNNGKVRCDRQGLLR